MLPETGHLALVIALVLAAMQGLVPLYGAARNDHALMSTARPLALLQFGALLLSFTCLVEAFVNNDFSVAYVAGNANSQLPVWYRISAAWGGHEGSLLLWGLLLAGWGAAVALASRSLPLSVVARVLAVMGIVAAGFLSFLLFTSNPFDRLLPFFPVDGADLNPLLQDIGLILHPPMLYMGYVGFAVAFAFAVAGLLEGRLDSAWARWSRPWTTLAWVFLTLGISLGSWWAYYELGWGGWWFWDPVENASLMPWLAGTALMHSLAVTEKRGVFRAWTVLLAIMAFGLSLLGTFLVRSGVLTSVHAFANDPARGAYILGLLVVLVGGALLVFALRAATLRADGRYEVLSREWMLLGNNVLLMVVLSIVFTGTLFPLVMDAFGGPRVSVGPPYFNLSAAPFGVLLLLLMAIGTVVRWKRHPAAELVRTHRVTLVAAVALCALSVAVQAGEPGVLSTLALFAAWAVAVGHLRDLAAKVGSARAGWLAGVRRLSRSYLGMTIAHLGLAASVAGMALVSTGESARDVRMVAGDAVELGDYRYQLTALHAVTGPNYRATRADVQISRGGKVVGTVHPEKRTYNVQRNVMTEAGIDWGLLRDHYVALGESLGEGAWAVRVQQKPFMRWVWLGSVLMAIGGVLAISDRRYRLGRRAAAAPATGAEVAS